jgi:hypothetical protein
MEPEMARPKNEGNGKPITITVPSGLHDYLCGLARRSIIGKSPAEVALYMLTQQVVAMEKDGFLGVKFTEEG